MTELEYETWVLNHCPENQDIDDFVDVLAKSAIMIIEISAKHDKKPVKRVVADFISAVG